MRKDLPIVFTLLGLLPLSGCALIVDGSYLIVRRRGHETTQVNDQPTGQAERNQVLAAVADPYPVVRCFERTRPVSRKLTTVRHFRYQNGFKRGVYIAPLAADALGVLVVGLGVHQICTGDLQNPPKISCQALYAMIPLGVDLLYAALRMATVKPPILSGRETYAKVLPDIAHQIETPLPCPKGVTLVLSRNGEDVRAPVGPDGLPPQDFYPKAQAFRAADTTFLDLDVGSLGGWEVEPIQVLTPPQKSPPAR